MANRKLLGSPTFWFSLEIETRVLNYGEPTANHDSVLPRATIDAESSD